MTAPTPAPSGGAFGTLLARIRHTRQPYLSQAKLAEAANCEHTTISRIESGTRKPSRATVALLADALGMFGPDRALFYAAAGLLEYGESVTRTMALYIDHEAEEWLKLQAEAS